tara:strand:+ start:27611 stop:28789 length:1179 start_codon:yes stop_codon:yes gene_type:complete
MAYYRTGTVTLTNGSDLVDAAGGANWISARVRVGDLFLGPAATMHEIVEVQSPTRIRLARPYMGTPGAGQLYSIVPSQAPIAELYDAVNALVVEYGLIADNAGQGMFADGSAAAPGMRFANDQDTGIYRSGENSLSITTAGVLRTTINGTGLTVAGRMLAAPNGVYADPSYNGVIATTLAPASGQHINLIRQGNFIWSIGYNYNTSDFAIGEGRTTDSNFGPSFCIEAGTNTVRGGGDNTQNLGAAAHRWATIYAASGTIATSDEREKTWRGAMSANEYAAGIRVIDELGFFQWNESIEEKGAANARLHFGVRAQAVWAIMQDCGLAGAGGESIKYGFLCYDEWGAEGGDEGPAMEAGNRYGIRPDQLALFLVAVQARRQAEIEDRLAALEG